MLALYVFGLVNIDFTLREEKKGKRKGCKKKIAKKFDIKKLKVISFIELLSVFA